MRQDIGKTIGIGAPELEALLEVRDCLRQEQLTFFDMRCGCFCIAGHVGKRLGMEKSEEYTQQISELPLGTPMRRLCYPRPTDGEMSYGYLAGQVEAARAIDRMLSGGDPWPPTS